MTEVEQAIIDGIQKLANHDKVIQMCEPNVSYHTTITENVVLRVLTAQKLIREGLGES